MTSRGVANVVSVEKNRSDSAPVRNSTVSSGAGIAPSSRVCHCAGTIGLERNPLAGIEPALRRSTIPTRILWGTADDIFAAASPDYLDRTLGASRGVRRVPGAKLFWPEEQPDIVADEARRLWAGA